MINDSKAILFVLFTSSLVGCGSEKLDTVFDEEHSPQPLVNGFVFPEERFVSAGENAIFQIVPNFGYVIQSMNGCAGKLNGNQFTVTTAVGCFVSPTFVQETREDVSSLFEPRIITVEDFNMDYHIFEPQVENAKKYPLILAMHGTVEGFYIEHNGVENPHLVDEIGGPFRPIASMWLQPHIRKQYPAYVVAPKIPAYSFNNPNHHWYDEFLQRIFGQVIENLIENAAVDPNRIYVIGHSVGGLISWELPATIKNRIAAILPMSGGYRRNETTAQEEFPFLSVWSFAHIYDPENGVQAARRAAEELAKIGKEVTVFNDIHTDTARHSAAKVLSQPVRYIASEISGTCVTMGGCHYEGADTAAQEPLFFSWLFRQYRIKPEAIALGSMTKDNGSLSVNWTIDDHGINDDVSIWLRKQGEDNWVLLDRVPATDLLYTSPQLGGIAGSSVRLTITNNEGFVYGITDSVIPNG